MRVFAQRRKILQHPRSARSIPGWPHRGPRSEVAAILRRHPVERAPAAGGEAIATAPDFGLSRPSCCDQAQEAGLDRRHYGGVVCCNGVKHFCVWPANLPVPITNAKAREVITTCAREHEHTHRDDVNCTGAPLERPGWPAGKDTLSEECTAYDAEHQCLYRHYPDCEGDMLCEMQVMGQIGYTESRVLEHCR
jgi:hypothetical protein